MAMKGKYKCLHPIEHHNPLPHDAPLVIHDKEDTTGAPPNRLLEHPSTFSPS